MPQPPKVLVIGLDGTERDLLFEFGRTGVMPNTTALLNNSAWSELENFAALGSDAMWTSIFTGVRPTKHGRYFYRQLSPGTYRGDMYRPDPDQQPPFWEALSGAGKRVAIIDVPYTVPSKDLNGIHLVDWLAHDRKYPRALSWPPPLAEEVIDRFGEDKLGFRDKHGRDVAEFKWFRDALIERTEAKARLACHYLGTADWDLFLVTLHDAHDAGHTFWHIHDPSHPQYRPELVEALGNPLKDVYAALDQSIGRILEHAGPETAVFLFAGPGMEPDYSGNHVLDEVLRTFEFREAGAAPRKRPVDYARSAFRTLPPSVRNFFKDQAAATDEMLLQRDRSRRRYFSVPHNEISGAIRLNVVGRDPNGMIEPGEEYEAVCGQLEKDLLDLRNVETGNPIVRGVVRTAQEYNGKFLDRFPDLFVIWTKDAPIRTVTSQKLGTRTWTYPGSRSGDHNSHCLLATRGPEVRAGKLNEAPSVLDIAPTVSSILGVDRPELDGRTMPQWEHVAVGADAARG